MSIRPYEIVTEPLSASAAGRPIIVSAATTNVAPAHIHVITKPDVIDSVWLSAVNSTATAADLVLIVNPLTAGATDVDAVSMTISIPAKSKVSILSGHRVRPALATYTIAAYSASSLLVTGHVVRQFSIQEVL